MCTQSPLHVYMHTQRHPWSTTPPAAVCFTRATGNTQRAGLLRCVGHHFQGVMPCTAECWHWGVQAAVRGGQLPSAAHGTICVLTRGRYASLCRHCRRLPQSGPHYWQVIEAVDTQIMLTDAEIGCLPDTPGHTPETLAGGLCGAWAAFHSLRSRVQRQRSADSIVC
jgi:hypothetical protein